MKGSELGMEGDYNMGLTEKCCVYTINIGDNDDRCHHE